MSTGVLVLGGMSAALLCAGVAGLVVKPTPRLAGRVRPYTIVARADLGRSADVLGVAQQDAPAQAESWVCCSGRRCAPSRDGWGDWSRPAVTSTCASSCDRPGSTT